MLNLILKPISIIFNYFLVNKSNSNSFTVAIMRVGVGLFFFASGYNKFFNPVMKEGFIGTLIKAGIPYAEVMGTINPLMYMILGMGLILGLFSRFCAMGMIIISLVALITVEIHIIPSGINLLGWYSWFFWIPLVPYIVILWHIVVHGSGSFGVDGYMLMKRQLSSKKK